jgi:uncharacterized protein (TIGR03083 family)
MADWAQTRIAFADAAQWFASLVPTDRDTWGLEALGEWTVRDLVGHTSRALLTVESYLGQPPQPVRVTSPAGYLELALASVGDPRAVAQRGREAGAALGDDLAARVRSHVDRVTAVVSRADPEAVAVTPVGAMYLRDYLPTRTFELTVHTCDLATALGEPVEPPSVSARASLDLMADLAVRSGQAPTVLLATTGRRGLPKRFSLL